MDDSGRGDISAKRDILERGGRTYAGEEGLQRYIHCISVCRGISGPMYHSCRGVPINVHTCFIHRPQVACNARYSLRDVCFITAEVPAGCQVLYHVCRRDPLRESCTKVDISFARSPTRRFYEVDVLGHHRCLRFPTFQPSNRCLLYSNVVTSRKSICRNSTSYGCHHGHIPRQ